MKTKTKAAKKKVVRQLSHTRKIERIGKRLGMSKKEVIEEAVLELYAFLFNE